MKKVIVTLVAIATLTISASAQQRRDMKGGHHKKHHRGMMAKELNFSEDQKNQAKVFGEEYRKKMQELNKLDNITVKEMRERKQALRKEQKAKMESLLTAEQKTKMVQLKADRKVKMGERRAQHMAKMKTKLGLTDEQVSKMKAQSESTHAKMKTIRENENLSREQKKQEMMALKAEIKEQHKKILTEDQLKKMEEMRKENHRTRTKK
jgi:periplasmic protein CpxP/Spy